MMKRLLVLAVPLATALCFGMSRPGSAEDESKQGPNTSDKGDVKQNAQGETADDDVSRIALAHTLVDYGRAHHWPAALITAAEILGQIKTTPLNVQPQKERQPDGAAPAPERTRGLASSLEAKALLDEARKMASDDPHVTALAEEAARRIDRSEGQSSSGERTRGAPGGPKVGHDTIDPYGIDTYSITLLGDEYAKIEVYGDHSTDLDLYLIDENGNQVAKDEGPTDHCMVDGVPKWTGPFKVRILNRGGSSNSYVVTTN